MENIFIILGFLLAAYSVIANDAIQTLGTFLSSNRDKKWWVLWIFAGGILTATMVYGWAGYSGDVSYGRLVSISPELPSPFHWWYVLPPLVLMLLTRFGIPVSTTFLILSVFSIAGMENSTTGEIFLDFFDFSTKPGSMLKKSLIGYALAITVGLIVYAVITKFLEKRFINTDITKNNKRLWTVLQWLSTGSLWSVWLIQDLANIYVYLPRQLELWQLVASLVVLLSILAYIFKSNGGEIQKIVTSKTNTTDIRSATIIDFIYAMILLFFKYYSDIPMSTTWVFVGLLAGREIAVNFLLNFPDKKKVFGIVIKDLAKVTAGLSVSILLVLLIHAITS